MSILNIFFGGVENFSFGIKHPYLEESVLKIENDRWIESLDNYIYKPMSVSDTPHLNIIVKLTRQYLDNEFKDYNSSHRGMTPTWTSINGPGCISPPSR